MPPVGTSTQTVASIAERLRQKSGVEVIGPGELSLVGLETLERAGEGSLTFIRGADYARLWAGSKATAALVTRGIEVGGHDASRRALIVVDDADLALNVALEVFSPPAHRPPAGVHPTAVVDLTASVGLGVSIGPHCVIGPRVKIGDGCVLTAGVFVGADGAMGRGCLLHPRVTILDRCVLGDGCVLHSGVVIGADGFGYRPDPAGRGVVKVPHIGRVEIGNGVEIGANSCIDRAKFGSTVIGDGTKIDNLVQIAHNCRIGRCCLIAAGTGIAGSVTVGDGVMMGGQVGIADNLIIGPGARLAAQSGVSKSVEPKGTVFGTPARDLGDFHKESAVLGKLARTILDLRRQGHDPVKLLEEMAKASGPAREGD